MLKKMLGISALALLSVSILIGCGSENVDEDRFSDVEVELIVENVTVMHREDMLVRDRGIHGVDMMLGEQRFVNINPSGMELDEITLEIAEAIAIGMDLDDTTELERIRVNHQDAFLMEGSMEIDGDDYRIAVVMFVANGYLYSMSYVAPVDLFETYYPFFIEIRDSIGEVDVE